MEGPRGTKKEEFDQVLELVNYVFRENNGQLPNMREQYSLLFNYGNLDNMRIIIEDGKPVSHIGISESEIVVYGCKTKIGSIGCLTVYRKTTEEFNNHDLMWLNIFSLELVEALEK